MEDGKKAGGPHQLVHGQILKDLQERIAALTAERDRLSEHVKATTSGAFGPEVVLLANGKNLLEWKAEAEVLRERVKALEAERDAYARALVGDETPLPPPTQVARRVNALGRELAAAVEERNEASARADVAESRLSAIRQRAGDRKATHAVGFSAFDKRGAHVAEVVDAVARYIVGDDAPKPEATSGDTETLQCPLYGNVASVGDVHVCLPPASPDSEPTPSTEAEVARVESSTTEAFARARKNLRTDGYEDDGETLLLLSLLERIGAARALAGDVERLDDLHSGGGIVAVSKALLAALAAAPPVFTLEEVEAAARVVLDDWQNEWTVDHGLSLMKERLHSARSR